MLHRVALRFSGGDDGGFSNRLDAVRWGLSHLT